MSFDSLLINHAKVVQGDDCGQYEIFEKSYYCFIINKSLIILN